VSVSAASVWVSGSELVPASGSVLVQVSAQVSAASVPESEQEWEPTSEEAAAAPEVKPSGTESAMVLAAAEEVAAAVREVQVAQAAEERPAENYPRLLPGSLSLRRLRQFDLRRR